ncbi:MULTISPECIES: hypothetical protein [unclassified Mameliella]|uniref:hypothetical protein n=1 Tax=Mameliella sp. LZ-28 TaxID=2484146 RepID=UPI00143F402D|nr:hypothetical protein [Mameliella sp. LZ-28]MCR9276249.1 hypothetical protein [Paracoccaceae bacterium]
MLIRCKIERRAGTQVSLDDTTYNFQPIDPDKPRSPHVALVENEEHIARLLSISEAYVFFKADASQPAQDPAPQPVVQQPVAQSAPAPQPAAPSEPEPDPAEAFSASSNAGHDAMQAILSDPSKATEFAADQAHEFLFGRKPNGRAHLDTVVVKIIEGAAQEEYIDASDVEDLKAKAEAALSK